ncbi:hypothetical protein ACIBEA_37785 [Streptomyces sp. NPDC051555]|uniref:hypothetical protein n=1 Tax=Streptomyces sp. NPDC051555 TaxID=3365657 RepID=UPI0037880110
MSTHHDAHHSEHDGPRGPYGRRGQHGQYDRASVPDATALAAAAGLGLLALGGWLLTTTRPWTRPDGPAVLALYWGSSLAVLLCGLLLIRRGVHAVHGPDAAALDDVSTGNGGIASFPQLAPPDPPA